MIEVKDHIQTASSYAINTRVAKFLRPRSGYVAKLTAKVIAITNHSDAAAAIAVGQPVTAPVGGWRVLPLLATGRIEPAAFALRPLPVEFVLVHNLGRSYAAMASLTLKAKRVALHFLG